MKLLSVSGFFESHGGGVEIVAGELARALGRFDHESCIAAASFDPLPEDVLVEPVPLSSFDPIERKVGLPMPIPSTAGRRKLVREVQQADAIIIHDALYASSLIAARAAQRAGKPWILIQHIGEIPFSNFAKRMLLTTANRIVTRRMLASAPQAIFISDIVREFFGSVQFSAPPKLLFNGVDHSLFCRRSQSDRLQIRNECGFGNSKADILFVGRYVEKKGVRVLRDIAARMPDHTFHLVGSGPERPEEWRLSNVRVLGRKSRAELGSLYAAADALILPSAGEGFPLVIQEAMASGLPIVCGKESASADPGARAFLHGVEVDLSKPSDTAARFAAAIKSLPLGLNTDAAEYASRAYDWDRNAQWILNRLAELQNAQ